MSLGVHRKWKKKFLDWLNPQINENLIDVASGTGDIAKLFSKKTRNSSEIVCVEPNKEMFNTGKYNLSKYKNIKWYMASGENLPLKDDFFNFYTISFGLRNVNNINKVLQEALRVLKPGGRFMCLEFSKVENEIINLFTNNIPKPFLLSGSTLQGLQNPMII